MDREADIGNFTHYALDTRQSLGRYNSLAGVITIMHLIYFWCN
jgi:hypothetical protein